MSLIGGETAEMPGVYQEEDYDIAGFAVGIVDRDKIIDGSKIKENDIIFGLSSAGIHSNGYSLVRKVVFEKMNLKLEDKVDGLKHTLGEELLTPTRIYVREILKLLEKIEINGMSHITGGGFYENIPRMIPDGLCAQMDVREVKVPEIFKLLQKWANIESKDMYSTFNMGLGLVFVVSEEDADFVRENLKDDGLYEIGKIVKGNNKIELTF